MESLTGQLGHISKTSPWLCYLLPHLYTSITYALGIAKANLIHTRADFRHILKKAKDQWTKEGSYTLHKFYDKLHNK